MKSWTLTRFLKSLTGLLILGILSVMVVLFIRRTGERPAVKPLVSKGKTETAAASRDIRHLEMTKGERGNFEIQADRHFLGEDGRYHLEGSVKYVSFREEGLEISAEKADYDQGMTEINLKGHVVFKRNDFSIVSEDLKYDAQNEVFSTKSGVNFKTDRLQGSARNLSFNVSKKILHLKTKVDTTILPGGEEPTPLRIKSDTFRYDSGLKKGKFSGGVNLERGRDLASADALEFKLVQTEERLREAIFIGRVRIVFRSPFGKTTWESSYFQLPTDMVEIDADELMFSGFPDSSQLHQVRGSGSCRFLFRALSGGSTVIKGDEVRFFLMRSGELREFSAVKGAILSESDGEGREVRSIQGNRLLLKGPREILSAEGSGQNKARFFSEGRDITAETIMVDLKKSDFEAKDGLKMVISGEDGEPSGFFRKGAPLFITGGDVRYSESQHRFIFKRDVKVWQDKQQVFSQEFIMDTESQEILCSGKVSSSFISESESSGEDQRIIISAETMAYNPKMRALLYQNEGVLHVQNLEVKAPAISIAFKEEGGIKGLIASGGVTFQSDRHEGTADRSDYDLDKETIVFTGNPVIKDKEKGNLQGDKFTFYLADDRIVVENSGLRRSITVIKS